MLARIIDWSIGNRVLVILGTAAVVLGGIYAVRAMPLDALPDLSDVQVIVFTEYPGQAPQVVEDQVTYPITTQMLAVPFSKVVRGYSFFGVSFVYVIFEDGTDLYWARSRVLEYLNYVSGRLPQGIRPTLGPDATGVGWAFMYALRSDRHDLAQLRSLQDWFLKYDAHGGPRGVRSGERGWIRQAVPDHGRPQQTARLQHVALQDQHGRAAEQQRRRRPCTGNGGNRVHGPQ